MTDRWVDRAFRNRDRAFRQDREVLWERHSRNSDPGTRDGDSGSWHILCAQGRQTESWRGLQREDLKLRALKGTHGSQLCVMLVTETPPWFQAQEWSRKTGVTAGMGRWRFWEPERICRYKIWKRQEGKQEIPEASVLRGI